VQFHIETFGCQMNKLDSQLLATALARAGHEPAASAKEADLIIFNTCSVRQHAENKVYSRVGALARGKRDAASPPVLVIMGCMAQKEGQRLLDRFPELDVVVGTRAFVRLPEFLDEIRAGAGPILALDGDPALPQEGPLAPLVPGAKRAFVSIMRGCENYCAYCVVPYVRGPEVSRPPELILDQVRSLIDAGVIEVILLGQNVNSYGRKPPGMSSLADLLARLGDLPALQRIRFITNHPKDMSLDILRAMRDLPAVMESLHLCAQSGSDRILAAMNRGYTRRDYLALVDAARNTVPGIELTGDFIVGFPRETEPDFQETLDLLERSQYRNAYIFKYSPRPGTAAAALDDDVPDDVKRDRHARLLALQGQVSAARHERLVGSVQEVLIEGPSKRDKTRVTGRSRGDHIVIADDARDLVGRIAKIRIESATSLALYGRPENP